MSDFVYMTCNEARTPLCLIDIWCLEEYGFENGYVITEDGLQLRTSCMYGRVAEDPFAPLPDPPHDVAAVGPYDCGKARHYNQATCEHLVNVVDDHHWRAWTGAYNTTGSNYECGSGRFWLMTYETSWVRIIQDQGVEQCEKFPEPCRSQCVQVYNGQHTVPGFFGSCCGPTYRVCDPNLGDSFFGICQTVCTAWCSSPGDDILGATLQKPNVFVTL